MQVVTKSIYHSRQYYAFKSFQCIHNSTMSSKLVFIENPEDIAEKITLCPREYVCTYSKKYVSLGLISHRSSFP